MRGSIMKKEKEKTCSICENSKPRSAFPRHQTQSHRLEYCLDCQNQQGEKVFIYTSSNFAIDMVSLSYADSLLLANLVDYKKNQYVLFDEALYRQKIKGIYPTLDTNGFVLAVGKYKEKRKRIAREKALQMVEEDMCVWEGTQLCYQFSGKELEEFVLKRDKKICYYCQKKADRMAFLTPRSQGGLLSPKNSVSVCQFCKEENGENLYFFKWVNVPILEHHEKEKERNIYTMWDKEKQTQFWIKEKDARTLIEEQMAMVIEPYTIHVPYNQKEFWAYIRHRDNWTCHYCGKYGDTVDHIIPRSKGGMSTPLNCVCACHKCNEKKSNLEKEQFVSNKKSN